MGDKSHWASNLRNEATALAELLTVGLLKLGIRACNALLTAIPAGASPQLPARDVEPPALQALDRSSGRPGDVPVDEQPAHTVRFGLDGQQYEIDLSEAGADEFRGAVQRYVDAARVLGPRSRPRGSQPGTPSRRSTATPPPKDLAVVRHWARANGYHVAEKGRIAASVLAAYEARE
jgi:Lsr2